MLYAPILHFSSVFVFAQTHKVFHLHITYSSHLLHNTPLFFYF
nr:MAG TPA: hypothetical protein [Caudoviricetes sp.]